MNQEDNKTTNLPKERYNILNGSIPLTESEMKFLEEDTKRKLEWEKKIQHKGLVFRQYFKLSF